MADTVVTPEATPPGAPPPTELGGAPAVAAADPVVPGDAPAADPAKPAEPAKPSEPAAAFDPTKLTLPEGLKTDDPLFTSFAETFGDDKLSPQERGQKLLDIYKDGIAKVSEANTKAWTDLNTKWVNEIKADPEIGGAKFETTKSTIAKAIDSLGPTEATAFRQALDATGAGNNPAIWRGLAKLAAAVTEGKHVSGSPAAGATKPSVKEAFYPNSPDMK